MKLVKEQIKFLELEKEKLNEEIKKLKSSMAENTDDHVSMGVGGYNDPFAECKNEIMGNNIRIKEIDTVLEESEIVERPFTEKIDVGSHIQLFIDFGENSDPEDDNYLSFILIEKKVGKESSEDFITIESDMGKAIFGKKAGDKFSYQIHNGQKMNGIIMSIGSEKEKGVVKEKVMYESKI